MKTYLFKYTVVPKDSTWSCDINNKYIEICACSLKEAVALFRDMLNSVSPYFSISQTAARKARKMFRTVDGDNGRPGEKHVQIGYVFNASTDVHYYSFWRKKYAEIWAEISELVNPFNK